MTNVVRELVGELNLSVEAFLRFVERGLGAFRLMKIFKLR